MFQLKFQKVIRLYENQRYGATHILNTEHRIRANGFVLFTVSTAFVCSTASKYRVLDTYVTGCLLW